MNNTIYFDRRAWRALLRRKKHSSDADATARHDQRQPAHRV